jgi:flagellar hook-basal body complex protein FliE
MADQISKIGLLKTGVGLGGETAKKVTDNSGGTSFGDLLKQGLGEMNDEQTNAQHAMTDMATGDVKDLHQAALAISKAELNMKMMLEVRNKAISAYKEISKTQI